MLKACCDPVLGAATQICETPLMCMNNSVLLYFSSDEKNLI